MIALRSEPYSFIQSSLETAIWEFVNEYARQYKIPYRYIRRLFEAESDMFITKDVKKLHVYDLMETYTFPVDTCTRNIYRHFDDLVYERKANAIVLGNVKYDETEKMIIVQIYIGHIDLYEHA